jgi:hypothetical protein
MHVQDASALRDAVDGLLTAIDELDLGAMTPAAHREVVALCDRGERALHASKSVAAALVAESAVWQGEGDRTAEEWLARTTETTKAEAAKELQCGRDLQLVPEVARSATAGELSVKQAEAIAGAAAVDPRAAGQLLEAAKSKGLRDLQNECRATRARADQDPEATRARIHAKRSYRTWTDAEGTGHLHLSGPADEIARADNAIRHRADRIFREARREGRREPGDAYAFDAATELLTSGGDGPSVPKGADAKIIVRVDLPALWRGHPIDGEVCEIAGSGPIPVSVVKHWMDNACIAAVLTEGTDILKVIHLGRRFKSEQRTALQWQDPICAAKGCSNRLGLEYDHFEDWALTRTTRVGAAKRFCKACHAKKSAGWLVSPPDEHGQCTFAPPGGQSAGNARAPTLDATTQGDLITQIRDNAERAIRNRRAAVATAPP